MNKKLRNISKGLLLLTLIVSAVSCKPNSSSGDSINSSENISSSEASSENSSSSSSSSEEPIEDKFKEISYDFKNMSRNEFDVNFGIKDEITDKWNLQENKGLTIKTQKGEIFQTDNDLKNLIVTNIDGDYTIETKICISSLLSENFQQGGIIIHLNNDNYIKLVYIHNGGAGVQFGFEKNGKYTDKGAANIVTDTIWLRIRKVENLYTAFYTCEGPYSGFQEIGQCRMDFSLNPVIGLTAFNGMNDVASVDYTFEYLKVMDPATPATAPYEYKMSIDKTELRLNPGKSQKLSAYVEGNNNVGTISYKSSDSSVATVDENGLVTAVGEGYALITANVEAGYPASCAVSVMPEELYVYESLGNPYLPIWEHIPDGEPYVFEDPDNPGKYRVYVYGSHDTKFTHYCGYEQVVWSAPVDDLTKWTYHGEIFKSTVQGTTDTLYAPDMAEVVNADGSKTYYYYPNNQTGGRRNMVCKSSRPDGPFIACNWEEGSTSKTEGPLGFDVAVLRDDDGRAYGYWGFENNEDCEWAELDPNNMATLKEGTTTHKLLPTRTEINSPNYDPSLYNIVQDEHVDKWGFFEAPSIRKVGNKYVLLFSRRGLTTEPTGCNTSQLAYGYSDSPAGPWKWGGIIVDANGETVPDGNGGYTRSFPSDNTHGSICKVNNQWYIFYHRSSNIYNRQSMLDPITVEYDTKSVTEGGSVRISQAEVTSNGPRLNGLDPYKLYPASIISYFTPGRTYNINNPATGENDTNRIEPQYEKDKLDKVIIRSNNTIAGAKYFDFNQNAPAGKSTKLEATFIPNGKNVKIDVFLRPMEAANTAITKDGSGNINSVGTGSYKVGTMNLTSNMAKVEQTLQMDLSQVDELEGKWGIFFTFSGPAASSKLCDFVSFELFTDERDVQDPTLDDSNPTTAKKTFDFTNMSETQVKENFEIVREDDSKWSIDQNGLVVQNQSEGLYGNGGSCKNIFLTDVEGDFVIETKVNLSSQLTANWQQFNLLAYEDDDNYVKVCYGYNGKTNFQTLFEDNGTQAQSYGVDTSAMSFYLRLVKEGNAYTGYYSLDGETWDIIGESYQMSLNNVRVGFTAHSDAGNAPVVDFTVEYFKIY